VPVEEKDFIYHTLVASTLHNNQLRTRHTASEGASVDMKTAGGIGIHVVNHVELRSHSVVMALNKDT
jgi:hypothetical protein